MSPSEVHVTESPGIPPEQSRLLRVLVVDDCPDTTTSLAILLRVWGHDVETAHCGKDALALVRGWPPDVALLDIALPRMDGYELARRLKHLPECAQTMLLAMTGLGREEDKVKSRDAGFERHLTKPVELAELEGLLARRKAEIRATPFRALDPIADGPAPAGGESYSSGTFLE